MGSGVARRIDRAVLWLGVATILNMILHLAALCVHGRVGSEHRFDSAMEGMGIASLYVAISLPIVAFVLAVVCTIVRRHPGRAWLVFLAATGCYWLLGQTLIAWVRTSIPL